MGELLRLKDLTVTQLQTTIEKVLTNDSYKQNALRMQQAIKQAGGVKKAADIIEQAVSTRNYCFSGG